MLIHTDKGFAQVREIKEDKDLKQVLVRSLSRYGIDADWIFTDYHGVFNCDYICFTNAGGIVLTYVSCNYSTDSILGYDILGHQVYQDYFMIPKYIKNRASLDQLVENINKAYVLIMDVIMQRNKAKVKSTIGKLGNMSMEEREWN